MKRVFGWILVCFCACVQVRGKRAEFEVASVRPATASDRYSWSGGPGTSDPLYYTTTLPLAFYLKQAYGLDYA